MHILIFTRKCTKHTTLTNGTELFSPSAGIFLTIVFLVSRLTHTFSSASPLISSQFLITLFFSFRAIFSPLISLLLELLAVSDHTSTTATEWKHENEMKGLQCNNDNMEGWGWGGAIMVPTVWETFFPVCVWVWGTWEITHYFIVLVFGGKALLKLSVLPSYLSSSRTESLLPSASLHYFLSPSSYTYKLTLVAFFQSHLSVTV